MNTEFADEVALILKEKVGHALTTNPTVFYGSSSFRLWDSLAEDFPEFKSVNVAFGGSTINDCIDYYSTLLEPLTPSMIVFYAGDNDIGQGVLAEEVIRRFKILFKLINKTFPEVPFVFFSIKPSPARMIYMEEIKKVNKEIKSFLENYDHCSYLDIHSKMMKDGQVMVELFCDDNLHMNVQGYRIWASAFREHLEMKKYLLT